MKFDLAKDVPQGAFIVDGNIRRQVIEKGADGSCFLDPGRYFYYIPRKHRDEQVVWDDYAYGFLRGQDRVG
jgi:hypothetical protein